MVTVNNNIKNFSAIVNPLPVIKLPIKEAFDDVVEFVSEKVDKFTNQAKEKLETLKNIDFISDKPEKTITSGMKVVIIGDSQTVGPYGHKLDELARDTKAKVVTHASWGSSPSWWSTGYKTNYKYWSKDENNNEINKKNVETPLIKDILKKEKPDIVLVTMGGNMMKNATQESVTKQVDQLAKAITNSGAKLVWVGPPKYDENNRTPEQLDQFYEYLESAVEPHGDLIDSRPHVPFYSGNDGLHYTGPIGKFVAKQWASGVFNEIQNTLNK